VPDRLDEVLRQAQDLGFFGPGPVPDQRSHAEALCALAVDGIGPAPRFLDLGSGGGLPGLVLAVELTGAAGTLLDAQERRGRFLERAVRELGLSQRIEVVAARAEDAARAPGRREAYDLLVARGFAAPAVTAECAVGLLRRGGRLAVSEPPGGGSDRWDAVGLAELGLTAPRVASAGGATVAIMERTDTPLADRWPRRAGVPQKRPLW
jgi:16S rRNA (guanine527-N7)-methyltransferase